MLLHGIVTIEESLKPLIKDLHNILKTVVTTMSLITEMA